MPVLRSSRGDLECAIEVEAPSTFDGVPGFEVTLRINGQHWDGDHDRGYGVDISGLFLRGDHIQQLRASLVAYLGQSLSQLASSVLRDEHSLAAVPGQRLDLRFGPRPDVIDDRKPVLTVDYAAGALRGSFWCVTDQSCLQVFADGLASLVAPAAT